MPNNILLTCSVTLLELTFYHTRSSYEIVSNSSNDLLINAHVLLLLLIACKDLYLFTLVAAQILFQDNSVRNINLTNFQKKANSH